MSMREKLEVMAVMFRVAMEHLGMEEEIGWAICTFLAREDYVEV